MQFPKLPLHFFLPLFLFHLPLLLLPFYLFPFPLHLLLLLLLQPRPAPPILSFLAVPFLLKLSPKKTNPSGTKRMSLPKKKNSRTTKYNFFTLTPLSIPERFMTPLPKLLLTVSINSTCLTHRKAFSLLDLLFPLHHLLSDQHDLLLFLIPTLYLPILHPNPN